jgi:hypothetical protein
MRACIREARARGGAPAEPSSILTVIALGVARDASDGWPARRIGHWIEETLGHLTRGLRLEIAPPPDIVGASTFARALGAFGHALRLAGTSPSLPFALARDPFFTSAHRFAAVFAALPTSPAFHLRALHTSARVAAGQARSLARAALLDARIGAARFLLSDETAFAPRDRFEELTARLFDAALPAAFAGAWPAARDDEPSRFLGLLGALPMTRELVDRFDVDWFKNPRAVLHLRALASAPARDGADPPDPEAASLALAAAFEEALG